MIHRAGIPQIREQVRESPCVLYPSNLGLESEASRCPVTRLRKGRLNDDPSMAAESLGLGLLRRPASAGGMRGSPNACAKSDPSSECVGSRSAYPVVRPASSSKPAARPLFVPSCRRRRRSSPAIPGLQLLLAAKERAAWRAEDVRGPAWSSEPAGIVQVDDDGYVRPIKPGKAKVTASRRGGAVRLVSRSRSLPPRRRRAARGTSAPTSCRS